MAASAVVPRGFGGDDIGIFRTALERDCGAQERNEESMQRIGCVFLSSLGDAQLRDLKTDVSTKLHDYTIKGDEVLKKL